MNIEETFRLLQSRERIGLMTHVVIGYPTLEMTPTIVETMVQAGADMIELQIPFSDPLADGPTIMHACEEALQNGTRVQDAFPLIEKLSNKVSVPLVCMAYYNTLFRYGTERFCIEAKRAGAAALIVPDMPIDEEEREHFLEYCRQQSLHVIQVISPTTSLQRMQKLKHYAGGFVYCTTRQGITGIRETLPEDIALYLRQAREIFQLPLAAGFGISQAKHIQQLAGLADMAIVGSALVNCIMHSAPTTMESNISKLIQELQQKV